MKLDDFCFINPIETLEKNKEYEFVEMADLIPGNRYVLSKIKKLENTDRNLTNKIKDLILYFS